jgi:hypothetical protein
MTAYAGPLVRPQWRGRTNVDALTILAIEAAEKLAGFVFSISQGSYQDTVAASAGTHGGGGSVDISTRYMTAAQKQAAVLALRKVGFAAWLRTPAQGPWVEHIHAVLIDHPLLAAAAVRQVVSYRAGRNGLKGDGPDDGPRVHPIPVFRWPAPPKELPKRVRRYLAETLANRRAITREIKRLKSARAVAKGKGEKVAAYTAAIRHARSARKALQTSSVAARKVPKR